MIYSESKKYNVAVVGVTGLVGKTFLKVLEESDFPVNRLTLFASERSKGKRCTAFGKSHTIKVVTEQAVRGTDIAFFAVDAKTSVKITPIFLNAGALVIDNSSFHRTNKNVPLIIPEINLGDYRGGRLIANPNCSTIQAVLPLYALKKYNPVSVNYTTFQAVSGSGKNGISDLNRTLNGKNALFYPYDISSNCIPKIGERANDCGYTEEEVKMINETKRILHSDNLKISATCVRVPVKNCHAVCVRAELEKPFKTDEIKRDFERVENVIVTDDLDNNILPVPQFANGTNSVLVGRIRRDLSAENALLFYTVADNLRRGAASNAVQTALNLINANKV